LLIRTSSLGFFTDWPFIAWHLLMDPLRESLVGQDRFSHVRLVSYVRCSSLPVFFAPVSRTPFPLLPLLSLNSISLPRFVKPVRLHISLHALAVVELAFPYVRMYLWQLIVNSDSVSICLSPLRVHPSCPSYCGSCSFLGPPFLRL